MKNEPPNCPVYLQALMPTPEDATDIDANTEIDQSTELQKDDSKNTDSTAKLMETSTASADRTLDSSMDSYFENPFIKPVKRGKPLY